MTTTACRSNQSSSCVSAAGNGALPSAGVATVAPSAEPAAAVAGGGTAPVTVHLRTPRRRLAPLLAAAPIILAVRVRRTRRVSRRAAPAASSPSASGTDRLLPGCRRSEIDTRIHRNHRNRLLIFPHRFTRTPLYRMDHSLAAADRCAVPAGAAHHGPGQKCVEGRLGEHREAQQVVDGTARLPSEQTDHFGNFPRGCPIRMTAWALLSAQYTSARHGQQLSRRSSSSVGSGRSHGPPPTGPDAAAARRRLSSIHTVERGWVHEKKQITRYIHSTLNPRIQLSV